MPLWSRVRRDWLAVPGSVRFGYALAPSLVFLAPFVSFLRHHGYEFARPEVWWAGAVIVGVGLILGAVCLLRPATLGHIVLFTCVLFFFDLVLPDFSVNGLVAGGATQGVQLAWHWAILVGLFALSLLLRRYFSVIVAAGFAVLTVSAAILPMETPARGLVLDRAVQPQTSRAPIIHLVLDEFIGVEGLPRDIAGSADLQAEVRQFFLDNGFTLHGAAFSHSSQTLISLAALLNAQAYPTPDMTVKEKGSNFRLGRNLWFDRLAAEGYAIGVYESSAIAYCQESMAALEFCHIYLANSISSLSELAIPARAKAEVILSAFLESAPLLLELMYQAADLGTYRLGALAAPDVLKRIATRLSTDARGRMVFAHLLMPHYSHVYDENCQVKPSVKSWSSRYLRHFEDEGQINSSVSRSAHYQAYFAQVRCTLRILASFFDLLRQNRSYEDATIIIHGDHGSRIGLRDPVTGSQEALTDRDLIDAYSTLYAVKRPGVAAAYDPVPRSIQALFADSFLGGPLLGERQDVVLRSGDGHKGGGALIWLPFPEPRP